MDLETFRRIEELFEAAMAQPEDRRASYIDAASEHTLVRDRVRRMLENATRELVCDDLHTTAGSSLPTPFIDDLTGTTIGPYDIVELIGEGGFGAVYRARQNEPVKRMVALKIIKLGMDTAQVLARFEVERQALAMMEHPSIARVFDAGVTDRGRPYFVMELVGGVPITRFCDQRCMPITARLRLFTQVCQAVQHAHGKGIIHRDLKPSNILVSEQDGHASPRVIDFGIAKATRGRLSEHTALTELRQFIGTPEYMSPEQSGGIVADVDTRCDVYALGVLLHELMVGVTPFDQRKPSTLIGSMNDKVVEIARKRSTDPRLLRRALRGDLDWIILKAMERDPEQRYDTAADLAHEIERFLQNQPVSARPPGMLYLAGKFARRHRVVVAAAVAIVLALVAGLIAAVVGLREANHARLNQQSALQTAEDRLWESLLAQARAARSSNDISRRFQALSAIERAAHMKPSIELRDEAIASLSLDGFLAEREFTTSTNVSAKGLRIIDRFADGHRPGEIVIRATHDAHIIQSLSTPPLQAWIMAFSHDGKYFAAKLHDESSPAHYLAWEVETGQLKVNHQLAQSQAGTFAFCTDANAPAIAIVDDHQHVRIFSLHDGTRRQSIDVGEQAWWIESDHTGTLLAVSHANRKRLSIWHLPTQHKQLEFDTPTLIRGMAFTHQADRLLAAGQDYRLHIWNASTGEKITALEGHQGDVVTVFLGDNSSIAATTGWDNTTRLWDLNRLTPFAAPLINSIAVGFCREMLTTMGTRTTLWKHHDSPQFELITPDPILSPNATLAVNPTGDIIAAADDHGIRLLNSDTGERLATLSDQPATFVQFIDHGDAILGSSPTGLSLWTLRRDQGRVEASMPARRIIAAHDIRTAAVNEAASRMVVVRTSAIDIYTWPDATLIRSLPAYVGLERNASIHPDGRWLFTGNWRGEPARVWDLNTGEVAHAFRSTNHRGAFSPAGDHLLLTTGETCTRLSIGDWREIQSHKRNHTGELAGRFDYSRDGSLAAVLDSRFDLLLIDGPTGRTLARIATPEHRAINDLAISADGSMLAAATTTGEIHTWNLHRIRHALAAMNLDW